MRATFRDDLMKAIKEKDMKTVISVLIHHSKEISRKFPFDDKELASLLLEKENLKISQLLAWYKNMDNQEEEEHDDTIIHMKGDESILL